MKFRLKPIDIINAIGVIIILYLTVRLAQTITHNYALDAERQNLKNEIALLSDQRDELTYNIQYFRTESFQEREARSKLGLQKPGENVIVLPQKSSTPAPVADTVVTKSNQKTSSNFDRWMKFLTNAGN